MQRVLRVDSTFVPQPAQVDQERNGQFPLENFSIPVETICVEVVFVITRVFFVA